MSEQITFSINGKQKTLQIEGWEKLLDVLRNHLELTGTKRGCDDGSCGACTVLVNGEAQRSCILPAKKIHSTHLLTVEGLAKGENLHPVQQSLIDAGAVQCGYCIPGIAMRLVDLFEKKPNASEEEIRNALSHHFCRCTGYEAILEGAKLAQKRIKSSLP